MKVLNLEDSILKHVEIKRALERCGATRVDLVTNQEDGMIKIRETLGTELEYDLIVSDMHYPLKKGVESDTEAGFKLIERLKAEGIKIPIIICSSLRFSEPGILGTVWYNKTQDIEQDFRDLINKLRQ